MKIYNSVSKEKEEFVPINKGEVSLYVCGPTLYGDIHIGNARPIVFFDVVYRYLLKKGFKVKYVSNITDIDDKIINKAHELGILEEELVKNNLEEYQKVLQKLNIKDIYRPTVTEHMQQIIGFIGKLLEGGFAYKTEEGDVYFRVNKIEDYGIISNRNLEDLLSGARIEVNKLKEDEVDFALWKKTDVGIVWDTPFGTGRPGWHTECTVMIKEIFGKSIDIHGGGNDLKFPHHENENAQYKAAYNENIANIWMHNGFVNIDGEKMSKSIGNFITVKKMLESYESNVVRLLLLQTNYRQPINLTDEFIGQTQKLLRKIEEFSLEIYNNESLECLEAPLRGDIKNIMDDDFNTPNLISELLVAIKNKDKVLYIQIIDILGLNIGYCTPEEEMKQELVELLEKFKQLRSDKNYEQSDVIKEEIGKLGYTVYITRNGIKIK